MSKAMQYMFILSYTLMVLVLNEYLHGWWWSIALFALLPAITFATIVEMVCIKVMERIAPVPFYMPLLVNEKARMWMVSKLAEAIRIDTAPYDWEAEMFHTKDEELIYIDSVRFEDTDF